MQTGAADWGRWLTVAMLVLVRISGWMVFAPFFSSTAISYRVKAGWVLLLTWLLAPVVGAETHGRVEVGALPVLGELAVGLVFGISLGLLNEILVFAGQLLGLQFSFSLVNLLDPNSPVETPLLSQLLTLMGTLILLGAGLDRTMLAALMASFAYAPAGQAALPGATALGLVEMAGGVFLAAVQLAAPVMAAALMVEIAVALVGRLSPQLPVLFVGIPLKTLVGYTVLIGSLAVWPAFLESRFDRLLHAAGHSIGEMGRVGG